MVGWHHQLNGHEFKQTPGDGERQGSLVCWSSWSQSWTRLSDQHWLTLKKGNNELEDWFEEITHNALWRDKEIEDRKEKLMFNSCLIPTPKRRE